LGERSGVLALLFAPGTEAGILAGRIGRCSYTLHHAARTELCPEGWIFRIVGILRLVLGIQMVKIAEEFVEAVHGRQEFVAVAEMILSELSGRIALRLQKLGDGRIFFRQPLLRRGQSHLQKTRPQRTLTGDESRAPRSTGLLSVIVGEDRAL